MLNNERMIDELAYTKLYSSYSEINVVCSESSVQIQIKIENGWCTADTVVNSNVTSVGRSSKRNSAC